MKNLFAKGLFAAACLAVLVPAACGAYPDAYIGVFSDPYHYDSDVYIRELYMQYTSWVWILPGDDGMMCAEFKLIGPAWNLCIGTTPNPEIVVSLGAPYDAYGVSACFRTCQTGWTWLYKFDQLPTAANIQDFIRIVERPDAGAYQVATCKPGYPLGELIILSYLGLNVWGGG